MTWCTRFTDEPLGVKGGEKDVQCVGLVERSVRAVVGVPAGSSNSRTAVRLASTGEDHRPPTGHVVHMDVEMVGEIPSGSWWVHGRGSGEALASKRTHKQKVGGTYLRSTELGFGAAALSGDSGVSRREVLGEVRDGLVSGGADLRRRAC